MKRAVASASSSGARTTTRPSGRWCAVATRSSGSAPRQVPLLAMSLSRYGPTGVTTSSTTVADTTARGRPAPYSAPVRLADALSLRSRRRKLGLFLELMAPDATTTVLDVGVDEVSSGEAGGESGCTTHNFFEERYPWPGRITALGLHDGARFRERHPEIPYVQGDACALPFPDGAFDVVHSNAVIEHVGGRQRQEAFVREAVRVGRRVFLTTPNRWFPLEVHTRLPFVHWLPDAVAGRAYDIVRKPWAKENHLLGPGDLRALFPGPVRVYNLGMTLVATT